MRRRRRKRGSIIGYIAVVIGALIVLSMVMPSGFWWIVFGVALIIVGIAALKSC